MNEIGRNLKRIRLLKNLSLEKAGNLLNMSAPAIAKYEKGQIVPNSEKLIEFANAYSVKVLDLLKTHSAPEMKFNAFRKRQRLQGQNLELLKEIIQNKVSDYLEVIELNKLEINSSKIKKYVCNNSDEAELAALEFRKDYKLSINQLDGLSEIVNNVPIIVLLKGIDGERQRFTIAHELGHLVLNIKDDNLDEEKLCNKFASALLIPKEAIINEFGISRNNISFYELRAFKQEYKVSMAAIVYRLKELGIIKEHLFKKINISFSANGLKKHEPYPIDPEESYQLNRIVHKLEVDKIISLNRACELLDITLDEYNNEDNNYRY